MSSDSINRKALEASATALQEFSALGKACSERHQRKRLSAIHKAAREVLFFVYEGGNDQKYYRHPASVDAEKRRQEVHATVGRSHNLEYDHAIPLAVWLYPRLSGERAWLGDGREGVEATIKRYYHIRIITTEENNRLRAKGLNRAMPADWDEKDVLARYKATDIPMLR